MVLLMVLRMTGAFISYNSHNKKKSTAHTVSLDIYEGDAHGRGGLGAGVAQVACEAGMQVLE